MSAILADREAWRLVQMADKSLAPLGTRDGGAGDGGDDDRKGSDDGRGGDGGSAAAHDPYLTARTTKLRERQRTP